jgi:hypothetical protein
VVDFDAAFGEQLFDVAVGETKRRYQQTASTITSEGSRNRRRQTVHGMGGWLGEGLAR